MIVQNDVKASNSVNLSLVLLQRRGGGSPSGAAEHATGNFGQTFAKFTLRQSALLTDPTMLKAKVEPNNTPRKLQETSQASTSSELASPNGFESANSKPISGSVDPKHPKVTDAPNQTKPDNRADAEKAGPKNVNARGNNAEQRSDDQAAKQTDDSGAAQKTNQAEGGDAATASDRGEGARAGVATDVVEAKDDVMLALAASDEQAQAVSEAPILAAQSGEAIALDDAALADAKGLDAQDVDLEMVGETKRDSGDSEKTSKLNLRNQEGEAALRGLGERMGRQMGDGAAEGDSHHRARAQMFAEVLSQNGGKKPVSGAEKATALVGTGATATSNALGLKPQTPLSGQAAAADSTRYVTRLNTPFQQPAWTDMMQGRVMWMVQSALKTATVYIDPPELGPVHITIQQSGDQAQVNFQVQSQSVRESLEQNAHRLRESLGEQGFTQVDVNVRGGDRESGDDRGDQPTDSGQSGAALASETSLDADGEQVAQIIRSDGTVGLVNTYA